MRTRTAWMMVIAVGLFACVSTTPADAAAPQGQLVIALPDFGNEVPVPWQEFAFGKSYMRFIYTALVGTTDAGQLSPDSGAATRWEMAPDGLTWTFWLRDNVTFHNGDPLTAEDVKFSIGKMMGPQAVASYIGRLRAQIASVEVAGPHKLVIKTKKPALFLPWDLSDIQGTEGMIQPKKHTEQVGDDEFARHPVGSGPYRVAERRHGHYLKLEAVDNHWYLGVPKYKTVLIKKVPEESTRIAMLKTGEADVISVSRERSPELKEAGFNIFTKSRWSILGMYLHEQWRPEVPIAKLKVRQALNLAVNREELAQYVFANMAVPGVSYPIPSRAPGADPKLEPYPYDPEKARQLLKEAGYPNGFEITMYSYPRADVPEMPRFVEAVAGYFAEIGVKAKIVPTEYASYRKKRLGFDLPGETGQLAAPNRPLAGFVSLMRTLVHTDGRFTSMKDPEMDRLIEQMEGTLSEAEAQQHLTAIYRYLYHNYNHLSVVDLDLPYATNKKITRWDLGGAVWDQNFLYLVRQ
ncbi:HTH-type transcriptional regulator SgrR [Candidatus Entotheonellaceae bacterium PAL068K]